MKKINLIVTAGIAATKSMELYDLLKQEFEVTLIITKDAKNFLDLNGIKYIDDIFFEKQIDAHTTGKHIEHTINTELNVVYPATYDYISKIAQGSANDIASLTFAASDFPTLLFPSMNNRMYENEILQNNKQILSNNSLVHWIEPKVGKLASGHEGIGRALEPSEVLDIVKYHTKRFDNLKSKNFLINFGRTRAYMDKVRYITNGSSGLMGLSLLDVIKNNSKDYFAVRGDIDFDKYIPNSSYAMTNEDMLSQMKDHFNQSDIVICSAALYDFEPVTKTDKKIEKRTMNKDDMTIQLHGSIDVLYELGKLKQNQFLIGFSLQNEFDIDKARQKMQSKNLDMLILNTVPAMDSPTNTVKVLTLSDVTELETKSKEKLAYDILEVINKKVV